METQIATLNVRGLGNTLKRKQMFKWLKDSGNDIFMLQEVHCKTDTCQKWTLEWGHECIFSGNKTNSEGVAILFKTSQNIKIVNSCEVVQGRILATDIILNDYELTLVNVYGPNKDDQYFFSRLEQFILSNNEKTFIIGGDYNTVINEKLDKKNGNIARHKKNREIITQMMTSANLLDAWRLQHQAKLQFTWHSNMKSYVHCRLDYFLVSENIVNILTKTQIKNSYKTDHSIVTMTTRGPKGP